MRCIKVLSDLCVVSCLVLVGIIGGNPAVSAAADPAIVLQSSLAWSILARKSLVPRL